MDIAVEFIMRLRNTPTIILQYGIIILLSLPISIHSVRRHLGRSLALIRTQCRNQLPMTSHSRCLFLRRKYIPSEMDIQIDITLVSYRKNLIVPDLSKYE